MSRCPSAAARPCASEGKTVKIISLYPIVTNEIILITSQDFRSAHLDLLDPLVQQLVEEVRLASAKGFRFQIYPISTFSYHFETNHSIEIAWVGFSHIDFSQFLIITKIVSPEHNPVLLAELVQLRVEVLVQQPVRYK